MTDRPRKRVAVYVVDDDERDKAESTLDDTVRFANVVEGSVTDSGLNELVDAGLVVEQLPAPSPPPTPAWDPAQAPVVAQLQEQASEVTLEAPPSPGLAADGGDTSATPDGDFYWIQLTGPITREQRLELDSFGVDIAAFEPPSHYRTFLTPQQHEQVVALSYVAEVTPYTFEDKLTPELVALVDEQTSGAPSLAADGDEPGPTMQFDCLLHREADLPRIRDLIADPGNAASVVSTSNLRIRFTAPVDVPLLGALATRPEVRQLTVYRPPTIGDQGGPR